MPEENKNRPSCPTVNSGKYNDDVPVKTCLPYAFNSNMNSMGIINYFLIGFKMIIHAFTNIWPRT